MDISEIRDLDPEAYHIVEKLVSSGYTTYYVGGWVRDYVLGHPSSDIDIATTATPDEIQAIFPDTKPVGAAFGIILVLMNHKPFEVATFRRDGPYIDGRFPISIEHTDPKEDAFRRDFTINGMFFDPIKGEIIDYVGGQEDLEKGVIRAIGVPMKRFDEDRLRMIRAVRFSHRFGFEIEKETKKAIGFYSDKLFPSVSIERIWAELDKMGQQVNFHYALVEMEALGLLKVILPNLHYSNIGELEALLEPIDLFPKNCPTILYILALYIHSPFEHWEELGIYFKFSRKNAKRIEYFYKVFRMSQLASSPTSFDLLEIFALEEADLFLACAAAFMSAEQRETFLKNMEGKQNELSSHIQRRKQRKYLINAKELEKAGIRKGPAMGSLIREGEKITVNEDLEDPKEILSRLKQTPFWPGDLGNA